MSANFKKDLERGQKGEVALQVRFPTLIRKDGLQYDFETVQGYKLETKFDSTKYENIFLEVVSNDNKMSPGGVFQSLSKKADYLVYVFERDNSLYCYKLSDLAFFLYLNKEKYKIKKVRNKTYNTLGVAVPIVDLQHLQTKIESIL